MFRREGGDPDWAPAFAGKATSRLTRHHPGGGRGPVGQVVVTTDRAQLATFPNWAPASAGVVRWTVRELTILPRQGEVAPKVTEGEACDHPRFRVRPLRLASASHLPLAGEDQQAPR